MDYHAKKVLVNLTFLFSLLPFIAPVPLGTDVQYTSFVFAGLVFFMDLLQKKVEFSWFLLFFLVFSIISFFFVNLNSDINLMHRVGLFCAFLIYYVMSKYSSILSGKILMAAVFIMLGSVLAHYYFPDHFSAIGKYFVRRVISEEGFVNRGASGFAPENSFSSALGVSYILIAMIFYKLRKVNYYQLIAVIFSCALIVFYSKSGLGYVFSSVLVVTMLIFGGSNYIRIVGLFIVLLFSYILISGEYVHNRGSEVLLRLLFEPSTIAVDGSIAERIVAVYIGLYSLLIYPFGIGGGGYAIGAAEIDALFHIHDMFPSARSQIDSSVSSMGKYLVEFGIIFVVFLFLLIRRSFGMNQTLILCCTFSLLFVIATFSVAFPVIYVLTGISYNAKKVLLIKHRMI